MNKSARRFAMTAGAAGTPEHDGGESSRPAPPPQGHWRTFAATHHRGLQSALAFGAYTVLALIFFWLPTLGAPANTVIGANSADVEQNLWFLKWWPYALSHHMNPFFVQNMWIPWGYNLAWQTGFPLLSLMLWPITMTAGVTTAYNVLFLSSFVLAAWCTYITCRYVLGQFWASFVGGYLFGFSGYMIAQSSLHIFLIVLFFIPISVYLYLLRRDGKIGRLSYIALQALPLAGFFYTTIELFTLYVLFLWGAIALYFWLAPDERRATLTLALETVGAFLATGILCSVYLYYMLAGGYAAGVVHSLTTFSSDVFGFVVPTHLFLLNFPPFTGFPLAGGNTAEMDSYLGLPLLLLMVAYAVRYWSKPVAKTLIIITLVSVALALGPSLHVAGATLGRTPMALVFKLPILEKSLPTRYALFISFTGALMAAVWIAQQARTVKVKVLLGALACAALIPNTLGGRYVFTPDVPPFFSTPMYQQYIKPNDTVLVLPISYGHDMLWQQATNYYFVLAAGYGGEPPHGDKILPVYYLLATGDNSRDLMTSGGTVVGDASTYYLEHYIAAHHIDDIVLGESAYATWSRYLGFLREAPVHAGGIVYFHTPPELLRLDPPSQVVPGDAVPRPYNLVAAQWNDATHVLAVPAGATGTVVTTLGDAFPTGHYSATITLGSDSPGAVAEAIVVGMGGGEVRQPLRNGVTRIDFSVARGATHVQIRIISLGAAAFTIGDTIITQGG